MKIKLLDGNTYKPTYATDGAAAMDFYLPEDVSIDACTMGVKIPLKVAVELEPNTVMMLAIRSGIGSKQLLRSSLSVGVIDSDYRGEIAFIVDNIGMFAVELKKGTRICQGIVLPVIQPTIEVVDELSPTERGTGGFGSTGV